MKHMNSIKSMNLVTKIKLSFTATCLYGLVVCAIAICALQGSLAVEAWSTEAIVWQFIVLGCMLLQIITGVFTGCVVIGAFRRHLKLLRNIADNLSKGNADIEIGESYKDELGRLVDEFRIVVDSTQKHAKVAHQIAKGDMTVEVPVLSEEDTLGNALRELVTDNNNTLLGIRESSMQLTSGSGQVASASQALAQGSTEQASAIEQISASMTEIAKDINANAEVTNQSDVVVREMVARATKGNEQMKEMMKAMHAIQAASKNISKVIKTIDDIAFQTNILALNATVEAARAGVHGKGFAVVAEEVKNLAEKSAAAAQETAELIQSSIDKVQEGSQLAEGTAAALDQTVTDLEGCIEQIAAIASACSQQATAVAQINQALNQVSQVVQTNSATSEECASASEELSNQAVALRNMISKYKLTSANGRNLAYEQSFGNTSAQAYAANAESVISLDGNFGKY